SGKRAGLKVIKYYADRMRRIQVQEKVDLIWVEKEIFPWMPWLLERPALPRRVPIVSDYDDAVYHRYDLHKHALVRGLLGHKIDRVMATSTLIMAGNTYLADRATKAGAAAVEIVPTVVDIESYGNKLLSSNNGGL